MLRLNLLKRIIHNDIIRVFSLNAIATFVRMLAGIVSVKVVAAIIGPSGIALLGQLNNFSAILLGVANGGIQNGVTKYIAEYKDNEPIVKTLLANALKITLFFSVLVAGILIFLHESLSNIILLSPDYSYVFVVFGFTIILYTLNALLVSILNGFKEFKKYVVVNICGTIVGLIFSVTLVMCYGLHGALINAVTYQSIVFFVTLWMCRKCSWFSWSNFTGAYNKDIVRKYFGYSLMTLTSLAVVPASQMLLRGYVISEISITEAGWWEAMNRISNMYLTVITTSFSVYYLPRLSEIQDKYELKREIFRCYKIIMPMLLCTTIAIYALRHFVIWLLFTPDFYPMESMFIWQLSGDLFKIASWLLAFLMLAKARTIAFISSEIIFSLLFVGLGFLFMNRNGTVGITQAYMTNYILYLLTMIILFRDILFAKRNETTNTY